MNVDHLHEHVIDPVVVRLGSLPGALQAGYSIEMKPAPLNAYAYPDGRGRPC